jgi:hypothetical protein
LRRIVAIAGEFGHAQPNLHCERLVIYGVPADSPTHLINTS